MSPARFDAPPPPPRARAGFTHALTHARRLSRTHSLTHPRAAIARRPGCGRSMGIEDFGIFCRVRLEMTMAGTQRSWKEVADTRVYRLTPQLAPQTKVKPEGGVKASGSGAASTGLLSSEMGYDSPEATAVEKQVAGVNRFLFGVVGTPVAVHIEVWREGLRKKVANNGHGREQHKLICSAQYPLQPNGGHVPPQGIQLRLEADAGGGGALEGLGANKVGAGTVLIKSWQSVVRRIEGCHKSFQSKACARPTLRPAHCPGTRAPRAHCPSWWRRDGARARGNMRGRVVSQGRDSCVPSLPTLLLTHSACWRTPLAPRLCRAFRPTPRPALPRPSSVITGALR